MEDPATTPLNRHRLLLSLRAKLLLFSLAIVVVPGLVYGVIAYASARHALQDAVGRLLAEVAHDAASEVRDVLRSQAGNIRTWAAQDLLREVEGGDPEGRVSRFLASLKKSDVGYLDLLCTDVSGRVVAASDPELIGSAQQTHRWFRTVASGQEFLTGPASRTGHPAMVLELAAPIFDPNAPRRVIGGLLGWYDWGRVEEAARTVRTNSAAVELDIAVFVLDGEGRIIAEATGANAPSVGRNLRAEGWIAAGRSHDRSRPGYVRETAVSALVGYARVRGTRPHWTALVVQSPRQALGPVYRMRNQLRWLLVGVVLSALISAVWLANRLSRPLRQLTAATKEIASSGGIQRPVIVRSRDEIGELAAAFNLMAANLQRAQEQLVKAAKLAWVGEMAAGVAHDVRTPLGILKSSAQILKRAVPTDEPKNVELVDMIIGEVDRLDRVIADLLAQARPREPVIENTALPAVLARALDFVDAEARERGIIVHRELAAASPARCDPDQIYQVALNLIVNALQVLPRGGELTVRTIAGTNGSVGFEVVDTGPGIPAELRERIFTAFFSLREGGTGLGLALVKQIVQAHHGTVSVESAVGKGTTFHVELPAVAEH